VTYKAHSMKKPHACIMNDTLFRPKSSIASVCLCVCVYWL